MTLHFEWFGFGDAARMALAHGLRKEVFVDEQGFSLEADRDEQDKNALHVLGLDETGAAHAGAGRTVRQAGLLRDRWLCAVR